MSRITEHRVCPNCGATIASEAPQGLCPKCLMAAGAATTDPNEPAGAKPEAPSLDQVAAAFPQLEILGLIGQGGMGVVFKARQPQLGRLVALKILPQSLAVDPAFAQRFAREARALAGLSHSNIVTIHDFGQANGFYYLLMEFVDGLNLRQLLQERKLTPAEALAIVPPLCDALQFAHDRGIVHRDIKPENLLLDKQGHIKVADFGIAKMVGVEAGSPAPGDEKAMGTPRYMAPEQRETPHKADHRADIYSLGVVFYEMLTGELPANRLQPPSRKVQIDVRLDEIVLRALEKTPELRWQTAAEFKTRLETVTTPPMAPAGRTPGSGESVDRSVHAWLALGFLLAGILGPLLIMAVSRLNEGGLLLGGTCLVLAITFGLVARRERRGRIAAVASALILVAFGIFCVITAFGFPWEHSRAERQREQAIRMQSLALEARTQAEARSTNRLATYRNAAGIGVALAEKAGRIVVGSILPNSPAAQDGRLQPGDIIAGVQEDGMTPVNFHARSLKDAVARVRGREGANVTLRVIPAGKAEADAYELTLTRQRIALIEAGESGQLLTNIPVQPDAIQEAERRVLQQQYERTMTELLEVRKESRLLDARADLSKEEREKQALVINQKVKILEDQCAELRERLSRNAKERF